MHACMHPCNPLTTNMAYNRTQHHLDERAEHHEGAEAAEDLVEAVHSREGHEALPAVVRAAQAHGFVILGLAGRERTVVHGQFLS